MQMLLRHTEPLTFRPKPVVSVSSLKFGGPSHSSSHTAPPPFSNALLAHTIREGLTIAVELARTAHCELLLASVLFVGAEGALVALVGDRHVAEVAEGEGVGAAAAEGARRVGRTVGHCVAIRLELERALLELLVGAVAWLEPGDVAREHGGRKGPEREKECGGAHETQ